MGSSRSEDLVRYLNLIPYFEKHPGRSLMEASRDLGTPVPVLREDLKRLWCCGLPGGMPDDLIDLNASLTGVEVFNNQGLDHALRLTATEAAVLLLTLESLEQLPGLTDDEAVRSAADKLRSVTGRSARAIGSVEDPADSPAGSSNAEAQALSVLHTALREKRQVHFTYHSASSDTSSSRTVSPARLFTYSGENYLIAFSPTNAEHRTFRADRISAIELLPDQAQPHSEQLAIDADDPFQFGSSSDRVHLLISPDATWMVDYYPISLLEEPGATSDHDWLKAEMPIGSREWVNRFALSNSDRLTVLGPESVTKSIAEHRAEALAGYDNP